MSLSCFTMNELKREVIVSYLGISGIVVQHGLIFPFIIMFDFYLQNDKKDIFEKVKPLVEHNKLTVEQKVKLYDDWECYIRRGLIYYK